MPLGRRATLLLAGAIGAVACQHRPIADPAAADARKAFGPDTDRQVLHAIEATSHTFVGGREALLQQLRLSLGRAAGS